MKQLFIIAIMISCTPSLLAQDTIKQLVNQGIQFHDDGNYDKAIETYKKALAIDSLSTLVNYEIAFSYFKKGAYEEAIKHADIVIDQNGKSMREAYTIKGSALDVLGRTRESIKLFEKAIKKYQDDYLLYFNLAVNYLKLNELDKAQENLIQAIMVNPDHTSSHFYLAKINDNKHNTIQALLAAHYFLLLEPKTTRSDEAYDILMRNFGGNISVEKGNPKKINITYNPDNNKEFGASALAISLMMAANQSEENKDKTEEEMFIENTTSFFEILGQSNKKKYKDIWHTFYIPFFYELAKSRNMEAYCMYILQDQNQNAGKWMLGNSQKLEAFFDWLNEPVPEKQ